MSCIVCVIADIRVVKVCDLFVLCAIVARGVDWGIALGARGHDGDGDAVGN